ncbi:MAG: RNA polymerase sigma factor [Bacteroidota bacterium]|nr:RNA polymerase sigma factor [Bacteroidota bacterium]
MPNNEEDVQYINRFLEGDEAAFNKLAEKYRQKIYWHARRMTGSHIDADEIVQEVLLVLYRKLKDFKFKSSLYTWIYKITSTRCLNYLSRQKVRRFLSLDEPEILNIKDNYDVLKNIEDKDKLAKLDQILKILPAKQRQIFILRNFEEMSYEEIAAVTGKSVGGMKANYFHALNKVMEKMNE